MMDALEFLRERALEMGRVMGGEQGSCDPHLIKTNWFDKRHGLNVFKEKSEPISNSNTSNFKMVMVSFCDNVFMLQNTKKIEIWIRTAKKYVIFFKSVSYDHL